MTVHHYKHALFVRINGSELFWRQNICSLKWSLIITVSKKETKLFQQRQHSFGIKTTMYWQEMWWWFPYHRCFFVASNTSGYGLFCKKKLKKIKQVFYRAICTNITSMDIYKMLRLITFMWRRLVTIRRFVQYALIVFRCHRKQSLLNLFSSHDFCLCYLVPMSLMIAPQAKTEWFPMQF